MFRKDIIVSDTENLNKHQTEAIELYREAQKQELEGNMDSSWKLYRKAFRLWPDLETLDFEGLH